MLSTSNPDYGIRVDGSGNGNSYIVGEYRTGREIPVEFKSMRDALNFVKSIH